MRLQVLFIRNLYDYYDGMGSSSKGRGFLRLFLSVLGAGVFISACLVAEAGTMRHVVSKYWSTEWLVKSDELYIRRKVR